MDMPVGIAPFQVRTNKHGNRELMIFDLVILGVIASFVSLYKSNQLYYLKILEIIIG